MNLGNPNVLLVSFFDLSDTPAMNHENAIRGWVAHIFLFWIFSLKCHSKQNKCVAFHITVVLRK